MLFFLHSINTNTNNLIKWYKRITRDLCSMPNPVPPEVVRQPKDALFKSRGGKIKSKFQFHKKRRTNF